MYLPTVGYCVLYGTAYLPARTAPTYPYLPTVPKLAFQPYHKNIECFVCAGEYLLYVSCMSYIIFYTYMMGHIFTYNDPSPESCG